MEITQSMKYTKRILQLCTCSLLFLSWTMTTFADTATTGPVFNDFGAVYDIKDLSVPVRKDYQYKVLFDISKGPESDEQLNQVIDSIARYINMHVRHGVKLENIDIAIILHDKATRNGLSHKAYEERYLVNNSTLDLIQKLHTKGVKFYQCGQNYRRMDIN